MEREVKMLVLTDIHREMSIAERIMEKEAGTYDYIFCLGDSLGYTHDYLYELAQTHQTDLFKKYMTANAVSVQEFMAMMRAHCDKVVFIPGNHDDLYFTDPAQLERLSKEYGITILHGTTLRLAPDLVVAGAGGCTASYDETEGRRISGWPYDETPSVLRSPVDALKALPIFATAWMLPVGFDNRTLFDKERMVEFCREPETQGLSQKSDCFLQQYEMIMRMFGKPQTLPATTLLQRTVERAEYGTEASSERDNYRTNIKPGDSVVLLLHQGPVGTVTTAHWVSYRKHAFERYSRRGHDAKPKAVRLPSRCGSQAVRKAIDEIKALGGGSTFGNIVCVVHGHTHSPYANEDMSLGIPVMNPSCAAYGNYMKLCLSRRDTGWAIKETEFKQLE